MRRFGLLAALVGLGITWGVTIPLAKIAVSTGHQPMGLIFWQLVVAVVVLGAICAVRRAKPILERRTLVFFLVIALLGTLIPNSFSYLAVAQIPAGVMSIVIASVPMFALAIALTLKLEGFSWIRAVGVLLGAGSIVMLVGPETSLPEPEKAVYVLVALVGPFCYGLEGNYIAVRMPENIDPVATLFGASVIGAVIAAPLALATGSWVDLFVPWKAPEWALLASSLFHAFVYTGYIWLVGMAGAVFASQIAYVVTVSGFFASAVFLGETHSGWVWAALALMIAGLALVQPRKTEPGLARQYR